MRYRPERPGEPAGKRPGVGGAKLAGERVHSESAREKRREQEDVVTDHHVVRRRIQRQQRYRLRQQMVRIRQRRRSRVKDVGVEDGAVDERERARRQDSKIPAEDPQIQVRIARTFGRAKTCPERDRQRPGERNRRCGVNEEDGECVDDAVPAW